MCESTLMEIGRLAVVDYDAEMAYGGTQHSTVGSVCADGRFERGIGPVGAECNTPKQEFLDGNRPGSADQGTRLEQGCGFRAVLVTGSLDDGEDELERHVDGGLGRPWRGRGRSGGGIGDEIAGQAVHGDVWELPRQA